MDSRGRCSAVQQVQDPKRRGVIDGVTGRTMSPSVTQSSFLLAVQFRTGLKGKVPLRHGLGKRYEPVTVTRYKFHLQGK